MKKNLNLLYATLKATENEVLYTYMITKTLIWFTDEKLNCIIYQVYQFEGTMAITSSASHSIYSEKKPKRR